MYSLVDDELSGVSAHFPGAFKAARRVFRRRGTVRIDAQLGMGGIEPSDAGDIGNGPPAP